MGRSPGPGGREREGNAHPILPVSPPRVSSLLTQNRNQRARAPQSYRPGGQPQKHRERDGRRSRNNQPWPSDDAGSSPKDQGGSPLP